MRRVLLISLVILMVGCANNKNIRISVNDFKKSYATHKVFCNAQQDYKTVYRRLYQAMRDCYSQPGFASLIIFGSYPNMVVTGEVYDDINQAQIIYGINRPTAGQQKDVYVEIEMATPTSARIAIYSWNTNIIDADKVAKSIKNYILFDITELYGCSLKK
ncbi:MAG: hypothetical protein GX625_14125 [Clostridiaceae bacterium]|nr:hypothetical protein [Clostridiaceae bacterium]